MQKLKVLVTGSAGFIGSHLAKDLAKKYDVVGIDNFSAGNTDEDSAIKADLLLDDILPFFKGVDTVFHFAANPNVRLGATDTNVHIGQNILATYHVLEAMRKNNVRKIVFASSSTVYGNAKKIPTPEDYAPLEPVSIYGASKLSCEALISAYCHTFGMRAWIFRLANIIGPKSKHGIIPDFVLKLKSNDGELEILGDGKQNKSYLYIEDCVRAIVYCFETADKKINIFNIGSETQINVSEIADIICNEMKVAPKYRFTGGKEGWVGDIPVMQLDISRIKAMGWKPEYTSRDAIIKTTKSVLRQTSA